jgi:hypothetical protein
MTSAADIETLNDRDRLGMAKEGLTADRALWVKTMTVEEYGLSPAPRSPRLAVVSTTTSNAAPKLSAGLDLR